MEQHNQECGEQHARLLGDLILRLSEEKIRWLEGLDDLKGHVSAEISQNQVSLKNFGFRGVWRLSTRELFNSLRIRGTAETGYVFHSPDITMPSGDRYRFSFVQY